MNCELSKKVALQLFCGLLALGCVRIARAQDIVDAGTWTAIFAQGDLPRSTGSPEGSEPSRQFRWWFDSHLRFLDDTNGFNQAIIRPGVGLKLTDHATAWAGYAWILTEPVVGDPFNEHRIWQQATWSREAGDLTFVLRPRLEQRFLETGNDLGLRFRQLVRIQHSLPGRPRLSLVAWDELFLNLNDTDFGAQSGFDQNRLFIGFGFKTRPDSRWRTEIGYLNQHIDNPMGNDRTNHIISINLMR